MMRKVQDTVVRQNKTPVNDAAAVYRVANIQWDKIITNLDSSLNNTVTGQRVLSAGMS